MTAVAEPVPVIAPTIIKPQPGPQELFLSTPADIGIIGGSVYGGKALALTTPIPTPAGWTTMGELCIGDSIFDENGKPTRILTVTSPYLSEQLYDVTFSDGSVLRADGEHLWCVMTKAAQASSRNQRKTVRNRMSPFSRDQRHKCVPPSVMTTEQIRKIIGHRHERGTYRCAVPTCAPLILPAQELPLDPYVLGVWLGDGTAREGAVTTADQEIIELINKAGFSVKKWKDTYTWGITGLLSILRAMGLQNNKHIPSIYLRASYEQRLALLQGLMDTDGTADTDGGCSITLTDETLFCGVYELLMTLGIRAHVRRRSHVLNGRRCADSQTASFRAAQPLFRLRRKAIRQEQHAVVRRRDRGIVAVESVPSEFVRCIGVDSPGHLYLAGPSFIPTHNTWSLVIEPLRHIDVPGFTFVAFRREMPDITNPGGLWDESKKWYLHAGGTAKEHIHEWAFPSGARGEFSGLQYESDLDGWLGAQICLLLFDQLETFTEKMFWFLLSRNRSLCGVAPYARASVNPNPDSFLVSFLAWWIDAQTGYSIPERSGVIRWFIRINDQVIWAETVCTPEQYTDYEAIKAQAIAELAATYPDDAPFAQSVTYVLARLQDNAIGLKIDPAYEAKVRALPRVERERLLGGDKGGNWLIRPVAGLIFQRGWFKIVETAPATAKRIRYWDKAGTEGGGKRTAGVRMAHDLATGLYYIEDVVMGQWGAMTREATIKQTAELDGRNVEIWTEQEPGSGGKESAEHTIRNLAGYPVHADRVTGDKIERAMPLSAQAEAGNVKLVRGDWNKAFLDEADAFEPKATFKDQIDAASGAFNKLAVQNQPRIRSL